MVRRWGTQDRVIDRVIDRALGAEAPVLTLAIAAIAPLGLWAAARPFLVAK